MYISKNMNEKKIKKRRGRPKMAEEKIEHAKEMTKQLAKEIRASLGKSKKLPVSDLLEKLAEVGLWDGGESLWYRYECGIDSMSKGRMFELAAFAYKRGARGQAVKNSLLHEYLKDEKAEKLKKQEIEEQSLKVMVDSIKNYLLITGESRMIGWDLAHDDFNKIIDFVKDMALSEYKRAVSRTNRNS